MSGDLDLFGNQGTELRDRGHASAQARIGADQDRQVIDQAIKHLASTGRTFTVDDLRDLLPVVDGQLLGARILAAAKAGRIERTGSTTTRHAEGHARRVSTWRGVNALNRTTPRPTPDPDGSQRSARPPQAGVATGTTPTRDRESITEKASRLLLAGAVRLVRVDADTGVVVAEVTGDTGTWRVVRQPTGRWACSCPAGQHRQACAHRAACALVAGRLP